MDYKTRLSSSIGMEDIREMLGLILRNSQKQSLFELLFEQEDTIAYNAAWVMTHFSLDDSAWLCTKQNELIEEVLVCKHTGKRRLLLTLLHRQVFTNPPRVDLLDFCFNCIGNPKELTWTRALCAKLAYALTHEIPELKREFTLILESMDPDLLTSSLRGVRNNLLQTMK